MRTSDFDYELPRELIAQTPIEPRDHSRLMVVSRSEDTIAHRRFYDLPEYLRAGDVIVLNDTRVVPARLFGLAHLAHQGHEILRTNGVALVLGSGYSIEPP